MRKPNQFAILLGLVLFFFSTAIAQPEELQLDKYQRMAYRVKPAVVQIGLAVVAKIVYVRNNSYLQEQVFEGSGGSGFVVNPDGYIVTNGHVVQLAYEYDKDKEKVLERLLISFVVKKLQEERLQVTRQNAQKWIQVRQPRIVQEQSFRKVFISNGDVYDFEIKKYSPFVMQGGKDVSVIKIEAKDLPVVSLGNSSELKLQQLVFPFGYPGVVDAGPGGHIALGQKTALEVSITRGTVSALKVDYKGVPVVQTDAAITHGNSGGPACNENGEVIGISTFGSIGEDPFTGKPIEVAGFNFLVPIDTAKEFINEAGVKHNIQSKFNEKYNAALDATWNKEWFSARDLINSALVFLPNQPDLIRLRQFVEGKVTEMGWFKRNWQKNKIAMVSLAIIILLILIVGATLVVRKAPRRAVQPEFQPAAERQPQPSETVGEGETRVEGKFLGNLTISTGGQMGRSYPIGEKGLVIGREPSQCDIVISDANVSRIHAWVTVEKGEVVVIDRGSTNGTFVNNNKVEKTKLNPGDVIQLGQKCPTTLIFRR